MSKTPFVAMLRRALRRAGSSDVDESRRAALRATAIAGATLTIPSWITGCNRPSDVFANAPRVAVIGAGIAGLYAAWQLRNQGVHADVYEASPRVGGRIMSAKGLVSADAVTELGGEYIDSTHTDMLALARHYGLGLIDLETPEFESRSTVYWFGGLRYTEDDLVREIAPFIPRLKHDIEKLPADLKNLAASAAYMLDTTSMGAYFDALGVTGWLRAFLDCAFITENGLETEAQSALNFLTLVSTDLSEGSFEQFGNSDERFKIRGGNQQIPDMLAKDLGARIHTGHLLEAIDEHGGGYRLAFLVDGVARQVLADYVVMAIPGTMLRSVHIGVPLSPLRKRMIAEQAYGNNMKIIVGFAEPFWHRTNDNGFVYTDLPMQLVWDNTALQGVNAGGLTFYSGGDTCLDISSRPLDTVAPQLLKDLQSVWPAAASTTPGKVHGMNWPRYPYAKASYAGYGPGQWALFYGREMQPEGRLFFAGEHCSDDFKGYMNGGAETGRIAAERVMAKIKAGG